MSQFRTRKFRRGPLPFRQVMLISFIFFILSTMTGLWIVNQGIKPVLISYADSQTKRIAPLVIDKAIKDVVPNTKDIREITEMVPDGNGGSSVQFKADIINSLQAEISRAIQANLRQAEAGNLAYLQEETGMEFNSEENEGISYSFPLGQATNNALLANLGPKIPIKFTAIGEVHSSVDTKVEQYPINNMFVEVSINVEVTVQMIIPFGSEQSQISQQVPVAIGLYPGDVPQFYNNGGTSDPSIQFPGKTTSP